MSYPHPLSDLIRRLVDILTVPARSASSATTNCWGRTHVAPAVVGLTIKNPSSSSQSISKSELPCTSGYYSLERPLTFKYRVKKAKEKKTKRAKTIKQLTAMGRRHLLGTRVVMKNMVYVTGMPLPALTLEEVSLPMDELQHRSHDVVLI